MSTESGPPGEMLALRQGGRRPGDPGVTVLVSDILTVAALPKLRKGLCSLKTGRKLPPWSQTTWFQGLWRPGGGENSAGIAKHAIVPTAWLSHRTSAWALCSEPGVFHLWLTVSEG